LNSLEEQLAPAAKVPTSMPDLVMALLSRLIFPLTFWEAVVKKLEKLLAVVP
jgi:hypothetical protein